MEDILHSELIQVSCNKHLNCEFIFIYPTVYYLQESTTKRRSLQINTTSDAVASSLLRKVENRK